MKDSDSFREIQAERIPSHPRHSADMQSPTAPEYFIPLARSELIDLLCADRALPENERELFRSFCERVSAVYHAEYHRRLLELKRAYLPFDPDNDTVRLIAPDAEE